MTHLVRAILIDPFECVVKDVEVDRADYTTYYPLLSHSSMPVDLFTTAYPPILKGRDALFVDDEGLLKQADRWFIIASGHQPFAGKGLIVGSDFDGDTAAAETSLNIVRASVAYGTIRDGKFYATRTPWEPPA